MQILQNKKLKILIISDHGFDFKRGTHSLEGFYSANYKLSFKPKGAQDFRELVMKSL
jgi:hypothetical protein